MYMATLSGGAWNFNVSLEYVGDSLQIHPVNINVGFTCSGLCSTFIADKATFEAGTAAVDVGSVFNTTISDDQVGFATSVFTISASSPKSDEPATISLNTTKIRCDSLFAPNPYGCVFPEGPSQRFFVDASLYPIAVEHIVQSQETGAPGHDIALTRITNSDRIFTNRATACPRGLRPRGMSCDEYPFATTKEGAASDPTRGHTFEWCRVFWLPDASVVPRAPWSACVMPEDENSGVGSDMYRFWVDYRVIDGDKFFVEPF
jgi:hypothetical protein